MGIRGVPRRTCPRTEKRKDVSTRIAGVRGCA